LIDDDASLVAIGARAFTRCTSLRCFYESIHLRQLKFRSSESLKTVIGDQPLDDALNEFRASISSTLFRGEVELAEVELKLPGWISVRGEGDVQVSLCRDIE
jgi:hypothetical protein